MASPSKHERSQRLASSLGLVAAALLAGTVLTSGLDAGSSGELAILGGTLHTGDGTVLEDAAIVISGGKIQHVGPRAGAVLPGGCERVDASGLHITPGFVDLRARVLLPESPSFAFGANLAESLADGLDPFDPLWRLASDAGVTTVAVGGTAPASAGSPGVVLKLRHPSPKRAAGEALDPFGGLLLRRDSHIVLALGISGNESTSAARLDQYYRLRERFTSAREYERAWEEYWKAVEKYNEAARRFNAEREKPSEEAGGGEEPKGPGAGPLPGSGAEEPPKPQEPPEAEKKEEETKPPAKDPKAPPKQPKPPARDLGHETLLRALRGEIPILVEAHRPDDIEYARHLAREFEFELTLLGGAQASKLAAELARARVAVALAPVLLQETALEYRGHRESGAAELDAAGVRVAIASGSTAPAGSQYLRLEACAAARGGLDPEKALRAVTLEPARALGLESRLGTIEVGKDADLVLFDGDPLDARSRAVLTIVEGTPGEWRRDGSRARWSAPARIALPGAPELDAPRRKARVRVLAGGRVVVPEAHGAGVTILDGVAVVIEDGKIARVETAPGSLPEGAAVHDLRGRWLLPGFIDAHSHITLQGDTDDLSHALNEELRVLDGFDPWSEEIEDALRRGVTAVALSPGRANVVGGIVSLLKLVPGTVPLRVVSARAAIKASLAPYAAANRYPTTTSGAIDAFEDWIEERGTVPVQSGATGEAIPTLVYFESLSAAERIQLGTEMPLVFLEGIGTDARTFAGLEPRAPVILGPYSTAEPERVLRTAAGLEARGIPFAFSTADTRHDLLTAAVLAIAHGASEDAALAALTTTPASIYRLAGRIGTIAEGADADLVVWTDNPFSMRGAVERVFIDGEPVFERGEVVPGEIGPVPPPARDEVPASAPPAAPERIAEPWAALRPARGGNAPVDAAPDRAILVRAERVYPVAGPPIAGGEVLVRGGKVVAVGRRGDLGPASEGVEVVEVAGSLIPGLIDAGSSLGIRGRRSEESSELTPAFHVLDSADLQSDDRRRALAGGVTSALLTPGARNVIGGLAAAVKTYGERLSDAVVRDGAAVAMSLADEASAGNQSLRFGQPSSFYHRIPTTRMGTVFLARRALYEAGGDLASAPPPVSGLSSMLSLEGRAVLKEVLDGRRALRVRADTLFEIQTALRIAEEFELSIQIEGAREAAPLAGELARRGAKVILSARDAWGGDEARANPAPTPRLPALLRAAGVPFAFQSEDGAAVGLLRERVAWCLRYGLEEDALLESVTLEAARIAGIAERTGSIEPGKDADLVAIGGDPFAATAPVLWVMAGGEIVAEGASDGGPEAAPQSAPALERVFSPKESS